MARQISPSEKARKSHFVILNDNGMEKIDEDVKTIFYNLLTTKESDS